MAKPDYDPYQVVRLWEKMVVESSPPGPEFLSTHSKPERRAAKVPMRESQGRVAGHLDGRDPEIRKEAAAAFDLFVETYGVKYERAVTKTVAAKLVKDRDALLAFYDFPVEYWTHIRTTNPIRSVFATVRNWTRKTKGCLNRKTALSMIFRLMMSARKTWRRISGPNRLPEVSQGVEFKDGIKQTQSTV